MPCTIVPITEFPSLAPAWDAMNCQSCDSPLLESRFVSNALQYLGDGKEKIAILGNSGGPYALAVLSANKFGTWGTFQASQLPLGAIIAKPGTEAAVLGEALFEQLPKSCQIISITQQDPDILERPRDDQTLTTLDYIDTAKITVDKDFEPYWASRGKNLRHNMKRQRNRLEREGANVRLEMLTRPEDMRDGVKSYGDLESLGWKAEKGTAVHLDNAQGRFYAAMLEGYAASGCARIYRFYYDDILVAVDLCIFNKSAFVILKTTYDESVKTSSPALLMRREYFPKIFDNREVQRIEFYGKVMEWHTKWSDEIRTMYHINFYRYAMVSKLHRKARN